MKICKRGHTVDNNNSYKLKDGRLTCKTCIIERARSKFKPKRLPIEEHFKTRYVIDEITGCWNWKYLKSSQGYGQYKRVKGETLAHRASYILYKGIINQECVCHKCDNPSCVNPDHLFLGSKLDNNRDRANKKRTVTPNMNLTHCKRGHEFNEQNTTFRKTGTRLCRMCNNLKSSERYHNAKNKNHNV